MAKIYYARVDELWRKEQKYAFLEEKGTVGAIVWAEVQPSGNCDWLTEGLRDEFEAFLPMGTKEAKAGASKEVIFEIFSLGVNTNRDTWAYNYNPEALTQNMERLIETYNMEVDRWHNRINKTVELDDFVLSDEDKIKWSSRLKECLLRGQKAKFSADKIRHSLYRPFCFQRLFFDEILTHRQGQFPRIFPTPGAEAENRIICVNSIGNSKPFHALMTNIMSDLHLTGDSQCFPFYTYDEDGSNRRENVTDWALARFTDLPGFENLESLTKRDIFHYVYAVLHHPQYREKYAANLRRELPHVPLPSDPAAFLALVRAGARLAELHVGYESQPEYALKWMENKDAPLDWRVEKMRLSQDKTCLVYNDFLTLGGIPAAALDYRLGNRSALEWVIDQYQVTTDRRSGIVNDPNRPDDPQYILRLIGKVITVSLETVEIVKGLPPLG